MVGALITGIISLVLGIFVFFKNPKNRINKLFLYSAISISLWNLSDVVVLLSDTDEVATFYYRLFHLAVPFIPFFFAKLNLALINKELKDYKLFRIFCYFSIVFLLCIIPTDFYVRGIERFPYNEQMGILYSYFVFYFVVAIIFPVMKIYSFYKNIDNPHKKNQIIYVFVNTVFGAVFGIFYCIYLLRDNFVNLAYYVDTSYLGVMAYAIIAHNLMDIDLAWRKLARNLAYYFVFGVFIFGLGFLLDVFNMKYYSEIGIIFVGVCLFFVVSDDLKNFFYNLFLGKYKKIWDNFKNEVQIKDNVYDKLTVLNTLVLDISKSLDLSYSAYYELEKDYYKIFVANDRNFGLKNEFIRMPNKLVEELITSRNFLYIENLMNDEANSEIVKIMEELKIELCYPIFMNNLLVGILVYGTKKSTKIFHKEDLKILWEIVKDAEKQLNNIDVVKSITEDTLLKYKNHYQVQILEQSKRLGQIRDLDKLCENSIKIITRLLNTSVAKIYLFNDDKKAYSSVFQNDETDEIIENSYFIKYLYQKNDVIFTSNLEKWTLETGDKSLEETWEMAKTLNAKIIIPFIDVHVLGFLTIGDKKEQEQEFSKDDYLNLLFICDKIQSTLANIYANKQAIIDELTGLYNRKLLRYRMGEEIVRSTKDLRALSIGMLDLDNFKGWNDNYGHDVGDKVLKITANIIKRLIRPNDECFRFGGDEFIILFRNIDHDGIQTLTDRFLEEFRTDIAKCELEAKYNNKVNFSIGTGTYKPQKKHKIETTQDIDNLIDFILKKADDSLYEAKKQGKNKAHISEEFCFEMCINKHPNEDK